MNWKKWMSSQLVAEMVSHFPNLEFEILDLVLQNLPPGHHLNPPAILVKSHLLVN